MVDILGILVPVIKGGFAIFVFGAFFYLIYRLFKMIGVIKLVKMVFIRKKKIPDEVYEFIIDKINEKGDKEAWVEIAEHFSKFPKKEQELWIQAYLEIKKEQEVKHANT